MQNAPPPTPAPRVSLPVVSVAVVAMIGLMVLGFVSSTTLTQKDLRRGALILHEYHEGEMGTRRIESRKFERITLAAFAHEVGLTEIAPVMMAKATRERTFSLSFACGSLEELLEQVAQAVPVNVFSDPSSIRFNLDLKAPGPEELDAAIPNPAIPPHVLAIRPGEIPNMINSTLVAPKDYDMSLQEFIGKIPNDYNQSCILKGNREPLYNLETRRVHFRFRGGTLRDLLEQVAVSVPVHVEVTSFNITFSSPYKPEEWEEDQKQQEERAKRAKDESPPEDPFAKPDANPLETDQADRGR